MPDRNSLEGQILAFIRAGGKVTPEDLLKSVEQAADAEKVEEAMQSLFDRGEIDVTMDWNLHAKADPVGR